MKLKENNTDIKELNELKELFYIKLEKVKSKHDEIFISKIVSDMEIYSEYLMGKCKLEELI